MTELRFRGVGFDVRAPWSDEWGLTWDRERRALFLLNESTERPLSVDRNVWPALGVSESRFVADESPVWTDHELMIRRLSERCAGWEQRADEIAVEVLDEERSRDLQGWMSTSGPVDGGVEVLGYDVADGSLTSALSNCGFDPSQKPALQREFMPLLNEHGLFADSSAALRFRTLADERVPEHAPFFVYRLLRKR